MTPNYLITAMVAACGVVYGRIGYSALNLGNYLTGGLLMLGSVVALYFVTESIKELRSNSNRVFNFEEFEK